jgi:streptogramin lyase
MAFHLDKKILKIVCFSMLFVGSVRISFAQELFISSEFTLAKSFTSGAEGPAVGPTGTVYAVNYTKQGTIGQVTADGKASLFIELPAGSIGNGIRFDSKGNMLIADYTKHNILKINMLTKSVSVFAHNSKMSQPNDIAIDNKDRKYR